MKIAVFDTHSFDRQALEAANAGARHEMFFLEPRLTAETAQLASGCAAVCSFVNDRIDSRTIDVLARGGTKLIALRSAGYNHVDLAAARAAGIAVVRVPAYSPAAVAEHAVALIMALNRKTHRAFNRIREFNFSLDGLVGFDLYGKTVGVVGTGRIGASFARIMRGFGCRLLGYDVKPNTDFVRDLDVTYVPLEALFKEANVISLHLPLTPSTRHLVDSRLLALARHDALLINTSRGGLIDTKALIASLKKGALGGAGLDVYEVEEGVFFEDLSETGLEDDVLARLLTFPNVVVTSHQGFLTHEALANIASTTLDNVSAFEAGLPLVNQIP